MRLFENLFKPGFKYQDIDSLLKISKNDIDAIISLYWAYINNKIEISDGIKAFSNLLNQLDINDLIKLDEQFRQTTSYEWSYDLTKSDPLSFIKEVKDTELRTTFLYLSSLNPNGYFREKALNILCEQFIGTELPFIFLRVIDWVEPIRVKALKQIRLRINNQYLLQIAKCYRLLIKIQNSKRNNSETIDEINKFLTDEKLFNYQFIRKNDFSRINRKLLISNIIIKKCVDLDELLSIYRNETDPSIKINTLNSIIKNLNNSNLEILEMLLKIKSNVKCKLLIISILMNYKKENAKDYLFNMLFDKSTIIRISARLFLSKFEEIDFRNFYIENIKKENKISGGILGLGDVGKPDDSTLLVDYLNNKPSSIIKAAINSIARLSIDKLETYIITFLNHEDSSISKTIYKILKANKSLVEPLIIEKLLNTTNNIYTKLNCIALLVNLSKWDDIYFILKYIELNDEVGQYCNLEYRKWNDTYNRSFTKPTISQKERLNELIQSKNANGKNDKMNVIKFTLDIYK